MKPRVLLADDHKIVTDGLAHILEPDYDLVGVATNGLELIDAAAKYRPDVIIVDISMPLLNGIEAATRIKKSDAQVKIVFLTMHSEVSYIEKAMAVGAVGFLLKHSASTELLIALQEIFAGRKYVSPLIESGLGICNEPESHIRNEALAKLSSRQIEVLQFLVEGKTAKEVGEILYISPRTVEFHKNNISNSLGIHTIAELVQFAIKYRITSRA